MIRTTMFPRHAYGIRWVWARYQCSEHHFERHEREFSQPYLQSSVAIAEATRTVSVPENNMAPLVEYC